jgi:hypothetical protein
MLESFGLAREMNAFAAAQGIDLNKNFEDFSLN